MSDELKDVIASGSPRALTARALTQETCRKWGYVVRVRKGGDQQLAVYRSPDGTPVGVKVRNEDKTFQWVGTSGGNLYGRHLWGSGGKKVVITEGEIDAMSVSQVQDHQWPVVSVDNGAAGAAKSISRNLEWLSTFDQVVIGFDMDEPGRKAAKEVAALFPAGKAFIVKWTEKDANAMLQKGLAAEITRCIWRAEPYRPDGLVDINDVDDAPVGWGTPWPYRALTNMTLGRRGGEVYTFGSGSGMGKTDFLSEIIVATLEGKTREGDAFPPEGFGIHSFEGGAKKLKRAILSKLAQKRFQIPQGHPDCFWTQEDLDAAKEKLKTLARCILLDHKGARSWEQIKNDWRFLHHAEGISNFLLDPLSAMVAGEEDERKMLDNIVLEASDISIELNSKVYIVSHLTKPKDGPSHEEGGQVRGSQFRGSNGILMYSSFVFGLERDQQADDERERTKTTLRVVKDRETGNSTGQTFQLNYDRITGTLDMAIEDIAAIPTFSKEDEELMPQ